MQKPIDASVPPDETHDGRLEGVLTTLERLRATGSLAAGDHDVPAKLTLVAELLDLLKAVMPELHRTAHAGRSDGGDAAAKAALEIYGRTVRELRAVALDARDRIDRAGALYAEAREFARRRRRRAKKIAARDFRC